MDPSHLKQTHLRHVPDFFVYVWIGNTVATLYQQYSKCQPKILQEGKMIIKLKPKTKQVSLRLSESCTHQHLRCPSLFSLQGRGAHMV